MIVGYCVYGQDNDSWMLEDGKAPEGLRCPRCGLLTDFNYFNPLYKIKKKGYDYSHPYDIGKIVSAKFKEFCIRAGYKNIVFKEFEWSPGFFKFEANKILKFDIQRSGTSLSKYCEICKNYEEVIRSNAPFLENQSTALPEGFYRTDYVFGSGNGKNPTLIVDPITQQRLKREKMKGLVFIPIDQ
jgi:hypothetical protein